MKQIGIGIIGAGEIAQNFHLPILKNIPNVNLLAICDRMYSKAENIANKFEIPFICNSVDEMLALDDLDGVMIMAPTDLHTEFAIAAIESNKSVFIEKPIAKNLHETELIRNATLHNNSKVMVGMSQRFRQDARVLKSYINNGELGEVFYIKSGWIQKKQRQGWKEDVSKSGGGVLMDLGLSLIDSILWMFDFAEVESVMASNFSRTVSIAEDISVGTIKFKSGAVATLECSWSLYSKISNFYFNVYGKEGSAMINPLQLFKKNGDLLQPQTNSNKITNLQIHQKSYETELKHFVNSVAGLVPVISTIEESFTSMKVLDALYTSGIENKAVYL